MKHTSNNRTKLTQKRNRRRKLLVVRNIVISAALLSLLAAGVVFAADKFVGRVNLILPYDREDEIYSLQKTHTSLSYADSFADDLCVATANVVLESGNPENVEAGLLFDLNNMEVLYAQNVHQRIYPASITKVITALTALEHSSLDDVVTVSAEAVNLSSDSQVCGLQAGDTITMRNLLYGLLTWSGNDAANAIAEHIGGGSTEKFIAMMNETAEEIGATKSHFVNAHGLHDDDHYTTAYDIYLFFNEALNYEIFMDCINTKSYVAAVTRGGSTMEYTWNTTNQFFTGESSYPSDVTIMGGKTGTTDQAGNCLVLLSKDTFGNPYVSVVLKQDTKQELYEKTSELLSVINK